VPLSWGVFVLLLPVAGVENLSWEVGTVVKGQGYHLQGPEIQKLTFGLFTHKLISVVEGDEAKRPGSEITVIFKYWK